MTNSRPEILFPLFASLTGLDGIGPKTAENMANMGVERPKDLLFTLPHSGIDRRLKPTIKGMIFPQTVTVEVEVGIHQKPRGRGPYRVLVRDSQTDFQLVFFHAREDWVKKMLPSGQRRIISGKVEVFDGIAQMTHPDHILRSFEAENLPEFEPLYPLTAGVTQKTMFKAVGSVMERMPELPEWIEPSVLKKHSWPDWHAAITQAHQPKNINDVSPITPARQRLAYDEFLAHQMTLALARARAKRAKGISTKAKGKMARRVLDSLPYAPTGAQTRAVNEILADMAEPLRMNRLLQGDVGSGKTLVAMLAMAEVVEAKGQAALMAPTEILARQHMESLGPMAKAAGINIEILTGRDKGTARRDKLAALASGEINILIGTHALFQKDIVFSNLRLAVIDEQHRFGVHQRMELGAKGQAVDILVMTATPIPRSLALAHYGDMDVSILDEKPPGRKPIETVLVSSGRMDEVVERLRKALDEGRQAYWVCPLVAESELVDMTAANERFRALRLALGEDKVGLVHGQMPSSEKDAAMAAFVSGTTRLLVATTVIEVGVDVPNATIMVIEGAENFGLAQLHQLRGRVGRGAVASTCLLMFDSPLTQGGTARLKIMRETQDGFRIADEDLRIRGAGDLLGLKQSGLPNFRVADLESQADLMETAQDDARLLLTMDPDLTSPRGQAIRALLYLMDRDRAILLLSVG
ncbi:MAG: ATP-dependent DNA helicase RecG [Rhodobacteraceae bacterium]|nr:ATP-dependent DNA helicase RecG [Paracoccaceae bacterium]